MSKRAFAEAFGTFVLVLGGCDSAVLAAAFPDVGIGLLGVSLAFGLTVLTMAYTVGPISGCHLNPAVTFGLAAGGRHPWGEVLPYWIAQVLGGIAGAGVLVAIAGGAAGFAPIAIGLCLTLIHLISTVGRDGPSAGRSQVAQSSGSMSLSFQDFSNSGSRGP